MIRIKYVWGFLVVIVLMFSAFTILFDTIIPSAQSSISLRGFILRIVAAIVLWGLSIPVIKWLVLVRKQMDHGEADDLSERVVFVDESLLSVPSKMTVARKAIHRIGQGVVVILIAYVIWNWFHSDGREVFTVVSPLLVLIVILALSLSIEMAGKRLHKRLPGIFGSYVGFFVFGIPLISGLFVALYLVAQWFVGK